MLDQAYATEANELPYTPDLHVLGTVKRGGGNITFWMYNPLYEIGYSKIQWRKHGGNQLEQTKEGISGSN